MPKSDERPGMEPDPSDETNLDHGQTPDDGSDSGDGGEDDGTPTKIADALPDIEEMAKDGTLASRIVILPHSEHLTLDLEEHPELSDEQLDSPVVLIVGARVERLPEKDDAGHGDMPMSPGSSRKSIGLFVSEVAVVHGKKKHGKKAFQKKVSSHIATMMHEKAAGTGPHSGKGGPLVHSNKQIQAIAYSKARRGE